MQFITHLFSELAPGLTVTANDLPDLGLRRSKSEGEGGGRGKENAAQDLCPVRPARRMDGWTLVPLTRPSCLLLRPPINFLPSDIKNF